MTLIQSFFYIYIYEYTAIIAAACTGTCKREDILRARRVYSIYIYRYTVCAMT